MEHEEDSGSTRGQCDPPFYRVQTRDMDLMVCERCADVAGQLGPARELITDVLEAARVPNRVAV